jgi:hypothetical protein
MILPLTDNELILSREHNIYAAMLSALPGLGHIYKGHYPAGIAIMLLGPPLAIWVGVLLSLATLGLGMLLPLFCWAWVAFDAFNEVDLRHHPHPVD